MILVLITLPCIPPSSFHEPHIIAIFMRSPSHKQLGCLCQARQALACVDTHGRLGEI